jgi:23S rRNA pseudouridine1911/1915/1917 synthase
MVRRVVLQAEPAARLDTWLAGRAEVGLSRSQVQRLVAAGAVRVDGQAAKRPGQRLRGGETVEVAVPPPAPAEAEPEDIPLDIVYEDEHLLVINKPRGLVVHPAPGNPRGTLVNALLHHCRGQLAGVGGRLRPGIVHRLDKDTTGLLVVAKTDAAALGLQRQIAERRVKRQYLALVHGCPPERFDVDAPIGRDPRHRKRMAVIPPGAPGRARPALTHFRRLEVFPRHALLEATLETGRTHQVRVHLAYAGYPVVGDPVYGLVKRDREEGLGLQGQALHAARLEFVHPVTEKCVVLESPLPEDMAAACQMLATARGLPDRRSAGALDPAHDG